MNILAIGAHPDDVEFLCAGTLARYAQRGDHVSIMVATNGNVGSPTLNQEEIATTRYQEALASAEILEAPLIWLGIDDEFLFNTRETRLQFIEGIRKANPDVIFGHAPSDYHPDHRTAGQMTIDCRIPVTVRLIETASAYLPRVPHVFLMDTIGGLDFVPEAFVDITDTFATKAAMLSQHQSQATWLRHLYGMDYVEFMESLCRQRGQALGVRYAEAFRSVATYPITGGSYLLP